MNLFFMIPCFYIHGKEFLIPSANFSHFEFDSGKKGVVVLKNGARIATSYDIVELTHVLFDRDCEPSIKEKAQK